MRKIFLNTLLSAFLLSSASLQAQEVDFEKQIYPLLKASCVQCHRPPYEDGGRMKKPKGGIIFATKEGITTAKDEKDVNILVPGKPEESRMLQVTLLPIDDEMHFPPDGKAPQWTKAEKDLFAKWIKEGANFGAWTADPNPADIPAWDGKEKE